MMNIIRLIRALKGGGNPMQTLMGMAPQNPVIGQAMQMVNGRTPGEMRQTVYDMAQQRGVDINQLAGSLGLRLPQ